MDADMRRQEMMKRLNEADKPISASALAKVFGVSRQIVVGDVALLRAAGENIDATPRGYVLQKQAAGLTRRVACKHQAEQMKDELYAIVDQGCTVLDVIVEHPVYGQLTGALQLSSRYDVDQFVEKSQKAAPLSLLTEGLHVHTIICPDEAAYERVIQKLDALGVLYG